MAWPNPQFDSVKYTAGSYTCTLTAASGGASISLVLPGGAGLPYQALCNQVGGGGVITWSYFLQYGNVVNVPQLSTFNILLNSPSGSQSGGANTPISLFTANNATTLIRSYLTAVPAPGTAASWTCIAWMHGFTTLAANTGLFGLTVRDTANNAMTIYFFVPAAGQTGIAVSRTDAGTSLAAALGSQYFIDLAVGAICFKIDFHASTYNFSYSLDGYNFQNVYSSAEGASLLYPNSVGFSGGVWANVGGQNGLMSLVSWSLAAG